MLKPYKHLKGYLHRWTFFESKKFHFRIHHILSEYKTPFLHNHPFSYLSIIISGGYEEVYEKNGKLIKKKNKKFSWIWRSHKTFHRITNVKPNTKTLFFTLKSPMDWTLKKHKDIAIDGQYSENKDYKEFILQYPLELSIEEFVKILIHKNQGYVGLTDYETNLKTNLNNNYPEYFDEIIHINIKDKFFNSIHKEIDDFFNDLLKKHKEKMNDINCFKLYVERSSNDFLVKKYLKHVS